MPVAVARTTEISAISPTSFEDAIKEGIARATRTLRDVEGAWIKDINVMIQDGNITGYKVNMEVTFVLDDLDAADEHEGKLHQQRPRRYPEYESPGEVIFQHVLLEDLSPEDLERSDRFLVITPASKGSGRKDISLNHD